MDATSSTSTPFYEVFDGRFRFPFSSIVTGPSLSGKTSWLINFLEKSQNFLPEKIDCVIWFYGIKTAAVDSLQAKFNKEWFTCVQGLPDINNLDQYVAPHKNSIFILDDLAQEAGDSVLITSLLNNYVHHKNIGVFLVLQDLFGPGRYRASFLKSVHYIVLFRNPLNQSTGRILAQRFMPENVKCFQSIYDSIFEDPYSHMLLDGHQLTPNILRIRANIFGLGQTVYIPRK
jgi:hypothetical protein